MVSPELIYIKFLNKVNKGNTQGDIAVDKERFVCNSFIERAVKYGSSNQLPFSFWRLIKVSGNDETFS